MFSLILFCIFLFTFLPCGCKTNIQRDYPVQQNNGNTTSNGYNGSNRGNSIGNISNGGYIANYNDWIYYYDGDKNSIYKFKKDEIDSTKIINTTGTNINIVDGWIIYTNLEDDHKIYRCKLDGSQKEKLNNDRSNYLNVFGNWIYYVNESDGNKIYKIKLNGDNRTKINNTESTRINVIEDWIYYCKVEEEAIEEFGDNFYSPFGEIYKIKTDGTQETKISDAKASFLNVVGNWIYYSDVNDGVNLYKMRIDGNEATKIVDGNCYYVNVTKENIYFSDMSSALFKVDLDGKNKTSIGVKGRCMNINAVDEWLYFELETGEENGFYKIKNDGTGLTKITSTVNKGNKTAVTKEQVLRYIARNYADNEGLTIEYLQETNRYGVSWENPGGGTGGYWEVDIETGDVFSVFGKIIGNVYDE